ncbi:MAG: LPS export ABC transporter permease LptG [Amphiplicatus sp.]
MSAANGVFPRYVGLQFILRFLALLAFFVIVLQMLDLLNESKTIMAPDGAGWRSLVKYMSLRAPQIVSQFTPFAALLAVVVTLSMLNIRNEITVMRAAGMSVHRVLFPIGCVCAAIAFAHFAFQEAVVIKATERLDYWAVNDYATDLPQDTDTRTNVRLAQDGAFLHADSAARVGNGVWLNGVTIDFLTPAGLIEGASEARAARYEEGRWRLFDVRSFDVGTLAVTREASRDWLTTLDPELLFALSLNPDRTPLAELWRKIGQLRADGADARGATTSFLSRFSRPLATLAMPLLGAVAGFGVRRQGAQLQRAVIGAALGFSYFVIENLMLALGKLGAAPAMLGAFFPLALFLVVGFSLLLAMEK